jgi:DNA adenine methylase
MTVVTEDFVIRALNKTYFDMRTGIGPKFGVTKQKAKGFSTRSGAELEMRGWPMIAAVGCQVESRSNAATAKPFVKWAGGKRQLLPALWHVMPDKFGHYYEPFIGGGALLFSLRAAGWCGPATLGDANERLVRTYLGVRNDVESVIECLKEKQYDKAEYLEERARDPDLMDDDCDVAAWFIYLNKTGFNGLYRVNADGKFNVPFGRYDNPTICDAEGLRLCAKALKRTTFKIGDFEKTLKSAERGDLVYSDPPYLPVNATSNFTSYTRGGFTFEDQERLAACAARLKQRGVHVILSNADLPAIHKMYKGFKIRRVEARRSINSKASARGLVGEVIIT